MISHPPAQHVLTWPELNMEKAFRCIPAGSFQMGSRGYFSQEEPIHQVEITRDFWLAETPTTQAQFAIWTNAEKIKHENRFSDRPTHPAENMDWHQAVAYCKWLTETKSHEFPAGFEMACLPSEAQWEYACRAGTNTDYYTGDGEEALVEAGWHSEEWEQGSTHPVAQKKPNVLSLYDMHGNVWEWCQDNWDENAYRERPDGVCDPVVEAGDNQRRVLRGGSWNFSANGCRSASRVWVDAGGRVGNYGFRVCLVRSPAATDSGAKKERV